MTTVTNAELKSLMQSNATTTNENFKKAKQAIAGKVDAVSGKGLSTNDFTNALKSKLEGLPQSVTIEQASTPESGMAATYQLKVGGVATGAKINILKDKYIDTPVLKTCETANNPISGLAVGDKYLEFPINNSTEKEYLSVADLYNVYQQGNGIVFDGKTIKIDTTVVATKSDLSGKQNSITSSNKLSADLLSEGTTNKLVSASEKSTWNGKQAAISDLATIRSGAAAGATAVQPSAISDMATKTWVGNQGYQTSQDVTDTINDIFGSLTITAWDNISIA